MSSPVEALLAQLESGEMALPDDQAFREDYPLLWEFMTRQWWEPGRGRAPGSLSLKLTSGCWQITITDPQGRASKSTTAARAADILLSAECVLADASVPWRSFKKAALTKKPRTGTNG
jgi:hypothetical protein